jgi:hypothetical protein
MRIFVAFLIFFAIIYFWDRGYNNAKLADGGVSMWRQISHSFGL